MGQIRVVEILVVRQRGDKVEYVATECRDGNDLHEDVVCCSTTGEKEFVCEDDAGGGDEEADDG